MVVFNIAPSRFSPVVCLNFYGAGPCRRWRHVRQTTCISARVGNGGKRLSKGFQATRHRQRGRPKRSVKLTVKMSPSRFLRYAPVWLVHLQVLFILFRAMRSRYAESCNVFTLARGRSWSLYGAGTHNESRTLVGLASRGEFWPLLGQPAAACLHFQPRGRADVCYLRRPKEG